MDLPKDELKVSDTVLTAFLAHLAELKKKPWVKKTKIESVSKELDARLKPWA